MTIAISLKVNDGVVLATDSASTIFAQTMEGSRVGVVKVFQSADKVFNLYKGLPIGAITWGSGSIGVASIATLIKDFRSQFMDDLAIEEYTIEDIVQRFTDFIYTENYIPAFGQWEIKPDLGFMVVGYSADQSYAEEWMLKITNGELDGPNLIRGENQIGLTWNGEPEAITRLYFGHGTGLKPALLDMGYEEEEINRINQGLRERLTIPLVLPAMPIMDAISLAEFLVEATMNFSKFKLGAPTVGGPIDVAAITKYEGFKWVKRKHYFENRYNPRIED